MEKSKLNPSISWTSLLSIPIAIQYRCGRASRGDRRWVADNNREQEAAVEGANREYFLFVDRIDSEVVGEEKPELSTF